MDNIKTILLIVGGCCLLVFLMIFGLSKLSTGQTAGSTAVDESVLEAGATMATESGTVKVNVVNFSDMECPACKAAHAIIGDLEHTKGVHYVMRFFPLSIHPHAVIGAQVVEAARQMGKGWEMTDLLFEKQEEWSSSADLEATFKGYAKSLGLDENEFWQRANSNETAQVVANDRALAERLQLSGTPTIYVNGEQTAPQFVMDKVKQLLSQ